MHIIRPRKGAVIRLPVSYTPLMFETGQQQFLLERNFYYKEKRARLVNIRDGEDVYKRQKLTLDDAMQYQTQALATIICEGDAIGAVALCNGADKDSAGELQGKLAQAAALFLAKQVEQ